MAEKKMEKSQERNLHKIIMQGIIGAIIRTPLMSFLGGKATKS